MFKTPIRSFLIEELYVKKIFGLWRLIAKNKGVFYVVPGYQFDNYTEAKMNLSYFRQLSLYTQDMVVVKWCWLKAGSIYLDRWCQNGTPIICFYDGLYEVVGFNSLGDFN